MFIKLKGQMGCQNSVGKKKIKNGEKISFCYGSDDKYDLVLQYIQIHIHFIHVRNTYSAHRPHFHLALMYDSSDLVISGQH